MDVDQSELIATIGLGYLAVGLLASLLGPGGASLRDEYRDAAQRYPVKAWVLVLLAGLMMTLCWPVFLPSA
jgi:hypothetical protein